MIALVKKDYREKSEMKSAENKKSKIMTLSRILFFTNTSAISYSCHSNNFFLIQEIFLSLVFYYQKKLKIQIAIYKQAALDFPVAQVDGYVFVSNLRH